MIKLHKIPPTSNKKTENTKTIIFVHGNSQSAQVWKYQLNSSVFKDYNLLAFDMPGHGKSPKMDTYSIKKLVEVLVAHINEEQNYILVGHSLGGHFCIEALTKLKNCQGLLLCGTPPVKNPLNLEEAFNQDERMGLLFKENLSQEEVKTLATFITSSGDLSLIKSAIKETDSKFRSDIALAVANGELLDEAKIIEGTKLPVAIVQGVSDDVVNTTYLESLTFGSLWNNKIHYVPKSGHSPHFENPEAFNVILRDFIENLR